MKKHELEKGETVMWDIDTNGPLEEFIDFAANGLQVHFGYDHLVIGFCEDCSEPTVAAACKDITETMEALLMLSEDYNCKVIKLDTFENENYLLN